MQQINWKRVLLGGLVAGLVVNVFESILNGVLFAQRWADAMHAIGKPEVAGSGIAAFWAMGFAIGIFAVWLYAELRPRYGAGPRTAAIAGVAVWVLGYVLANVPALVTHVFPRRLMVTLVAVGLVEAVVATIAGAAVYREQAAPMAKAVAR